MNLHKKSWVSLLGGLAIAVAALVHTSTVRANVYATNIKLNGSLTGAKSVASGGSFTITYILNEAATAGATIDILSGANVVNTITIASGNPGTSQGLNTVICVATNSSGASLPVGSYSVSIAAASTGFGAWTQTTSDSNPGNYVYWPSGIAVNANTNSPYYGRVMIANGGPKNTGTTPGDTNGVVKLNSDGSFADEGQANAGYNFAYDGFLGDVPRRGRIAADDRFYFNDWSGPGRIVAVDMLMTSNQVILDIANDTGPEKTGNFSDMDVVDVGTSNAVAYMSDFSFPSQGVWMWAITNNGAVDPSNTTGTQVVASPGDGGPGEDIPLRAGPGLMIDDNKDIFIGEIRSNSGDPTPRATCITNWPSSPDQPLIFDNISWQVGGGDNTFEDISDLAIDSRTNPKYVACTMNGGSGGIRILNAADGSVAVNINQSGTVFYLSVGWDNVGNVYAGHAGHVWQAFSPPGANTNTTVAVATMSVSTSVTQPVISSIVVSGATVTLKFTAGAGDSPSAFTLLGSSTVTPASGYAPVGGATITQLSPGSFQATTSSSGSSHFYQIKR